MSARDFRVLECSGCKDRTICPVPVQEASWIGRCRECGTRNHPYAVKQSSAQECLLLCLLAGGKGIEVPLAHGAQWRDVYYNLRGYNALHIIMLRMHTPGEDRVVLLDRALLAGCDLHARCQRIATLGFSPAQIAYRHPDPRVGEVVLFHRNERRRAAAALAEALHSEQSALYRAKAHVIFDHRFDVLKQALSFLHPYLPAKGKAAKRKLEDGDQ